MNIEQHTHTEQKKTQNQLPQLGSKKKKNKRQQITQVNHVMF